MKKIFNYIASLWNNFINFFKKKKMPKRIPDFKLFTEINSCTIKGGTLQIKPKGSDFWYDVLTPSFAEGVHFTVKSATVPNRTIIELDEIDEIRCSLDY